MSKSSALQFRKGRPGDLYAIRRLLRMMDMDDQINPCSCLVCEKDARLLGFARVEVVEGEPYIRPIVVDSPAQGSGVGRQLVQRLAQEWPHLRVVARGEMVGFYTRLGFKPMGWEEVYPPFVDECCNCPKLANCQPKPLKLPG